jgi:phosphatidate cytidylyltransferase
LNELAKRVSVAIFGIPLAIILILNGGVYFSFAILILSLVSMYEFQNLFASKEIKINKLISNTFNVSVFLLIIAFLNFKISTFNPNWYIAVFHCIILIFATIVYLNQLWSKEKEPILATASTLFSFFYITIPFVSLLLIRNIELISLNINSITTDNMFNPSKAGFIVLTFFISIWSCDSFAYFIGRKYGKHKLFPRHSPKKSWEGAIAGFIGSILAFYILNIVFSINLKPIHSILLGTLIGILGQMGDLFESNLKRWAEIKDSSNLIPGHGGFLDRFDSIIFTSPLILVYLILVSL